MSIESFEQLFHQLNGTDDDLRRAADESLTELVNNPESIKILLDFFQNFVEKPQLQEFVVVLLGRSITLNIEKIDEQVINEITSSIIETFVGSDSYQDSFLNMSRTIYKQFPQTQEIFESAFECLSEKPILLFGLLNVLLSKENYENYA